MQARESYIAVEVIVTSWRVKWREMMMEICRVEDGMAFTVSPLLHAYTFFHLILISCCYIIHANVRLFVQTPPTESPRPSSRSTRPSSQPRSDMKRS
jgi:hypothetical protein